MNLLKTILVLKLVFISFFIQAQRVSSYFETIAINSVELLENFKDIYIKPDTTNIYYLVRVLESSKRNRIDYYIEFTYDKNIAIQYSPDFYINCNNFVHILILNDSKQELASPLLPDNEYLKSILDNSADISGGSFVNFPTIYYFSTKWHSKKDKIEINYCYKKFPEIDIKNRPIRKYPDYPYLMYDTISNYYPSRIQRAYYESFGSMMPNSLFNSVIKGKRIISLEEE
ncbi:MAG: hypothetical protein B7C24_01510 [Bacteroidetes bacterium 4572_77]|nr:MAG: hypothetical protein B7C24_01510 [Bacteroidetes bacterium 4572_77]